MARSLYSQQKTNLTRATRVSDPLERFNAVVRATRKAVAQWEDDYNGVWPDDWHRWDRALDDAHADVRYAYVDGRIDSVPDHVTVDDLIPGCDHDWQLVETGYVRTWSAQLDETTGTVSTGEGTFSDDGTDTSLQCLSCSETRSVESLTINWL